MISSTRKNGDEVTNVDMETKSGEGASAPRDDGDGGQSGKVKSSGPTFTLEKRHTESLHVECPICKKKFLRNQVQIHAAICAQKMYPTRRSPKSSKKKKKKEKTESSSTKSTPASPKPKQKKKIRSYTRRLTKCMIFDFEIYEKVPRGVERTAIARAARLSKRSYKAKSAKKKVEKTRKRVQREDEDPYASASFSEEEDDHLDADYNEKPRKKRKYTRRKKSSDSTVQVKKKKRKYTKRGTKKRKSKTVKVEPPTVEPVISLDLRYYPKKVVQHSKWAPDYLRKTREVRQNDASDFIQDLAVYYAKTPAKLQRFFYILREFSRNEMSVRDVTNQLANLFSDRIDFMIRLNQFLPPDTWMEDLPQFQRSVEEKKGQMRTDDSCEPILKADAFVASAYFDRVRQHFSGNPEKFQRFIEIVISSDAGFKRGHKDMESVAESIGNIKKAMADLFNEDKDEELLKDFQAFLPQHSPIEVVSSSKSAPAAECAVSSAADEQPKAVVHDATAEK